MSHARASGARGSLALVRTLPRRAVSRAVGVAARLPLPPILLAPLLWLYARAYRADLAEAEAPLWAHRCFLDFFARRLRPGVRPLPSDPQAIACPADGTVHAAGRIDDDTLLQAKGVPYRLSDLLAAPRPDLAGGSHLTLHLGPGDCHRFHWPFDARVHEVRHLPGDLWPVHAGAVRTFPSLLARNERVVVTGTLRRGGCFVVVAVGALNVGSIRLAFHRLRTNRGGPARVRRSVPEHGAVERGAEMGWFELGSALVVCLSPDAGTIDPVPAATRLRIGQAIGRLAQPPG